AVARPGTRAGGRSGDVGAVTDVVHEGAGTGIDVGGAALVAVVEDVAPDLPGWVPGRAAVGLVPGEQHARAALGVAEVGVLEIEARVVDADDHALAGEAEEAPAGALAQALHADLLRADVVGENCGGREAGRGRRGVPVRAVQSAGLRAENPGNGRIEAERAAAPGGRLRPAAASAREHGRPAGSKRGRRLDAKNRRVADQDLEPVHRHAGGHDVPGA